MKLILENWRKYLKEEKVGMMTVDDLVENDLHILVKKSPITDHSIDFYYARRHERPAEDAYEILGSPAAGPVYGNVEIANYEAEVDEDGPCGLAWQVKYSQAANKWGPLLYDVAIEYATLWGDAHCPDPKGCGGLIPDREQVSVHARAVWDYYLNKRAGVDGFQLDDLYDTLTPDIQVDNCDQSVASFNPDDARDKNVHWPDSPLSKRYKKEPVTIDKLRELGRFKDET